MSPDWRHLVYMRPGLRTSSDVLLNNRYALASIAIFVHLLKPLIWETCAQYFVCLTRRTLQGYAINHAGADQHDTRPQASQRERTTAMLIEPCSTVMHAIAAPHNHGSRRLVSKQIATEPIVRLKHSNPIRSCQEKHWFQGFFFNLTTSLEDNDEFRKHLTPPIWNYRPLANGNPWILQRSD